jgi:ketosteroid isomerase-like protein
MNRACNRVSGKAIDLELCSGLLSVTRMPGTMDKISATASSRAVLGLALATVLLAGLCLSPALAGQVRPAGLPRGQRHEVRHEIDQMEESWRNAVLKGNTTTLDSLLADDFMAISASGTLQTKEETLANLRTGRTHFTSLTISDRKVRFYGTTALVTSLAEAQGTTGDGEISGSYRFTRVYVRDAQGAWKIVSFEASKIREPGEHK